jgi:hypothetical protein
MHQRLEIFIGDNIIHEGVIEIPNHFTEREIKNRVEKYFNSLNLSGFHGQGRVEITEIEN